MKKLIDIVLKTNKLVPGPIVRKDGFVSPIYLNAREVFADKRFIAKFPKYAKLALKDVPNYDVIAGIEFAGLPIASLLGYCLKKDTAYIRKKPKKYLIKKTVEGDVLGKRVIICDDLMLQGEMKNHAIKAVEKAGGKVVGIFVLFTADPISNLFATKHKIKIWRLADLDEVFQRALDKKIISQQLYDLKRTIFQMRTWRTWHKNKKLWQQFEELQTIDPLFLKRK
ncbi:hypothetical protein HYZ64_01240 [Candidatus Berkelbacteria bacterium]|nr:hypothetical protein [Candidatus Berkelbacteria bacterium]